MAWGYYQMNKHYISKILRAGLICLYMGISSVWLNASTLTSLSTISPQVLSSLNIGGTDMASVTHVEMNGVSVAFHRVSSTTVTVLVPQPTFPGQLTGFVTLRSTTGDAVSTQSVTVNPAARVTRLGYTWTTAGKFVFLDGANLQNATSATIDGVGVPLVQVNALRVMLPVSDFASAIGKTVAVNTPQGNISSTLSAASI